MPSHDLPNCGVIKWILLYCSVFLLSLLSLLLSLSSQMGRDEPTASAGPEQHPGVQAAPPVLHQPVERRHRQPDGGAAVRPPLPALRRTAPEG